VNNIWKQRNFAFDAALIILRPLVTEL